MTYDTYCQHDNIENMYYGKCPKIVYTKVSDNMTYANSADPDQIVP